jgi:pimeloyl-ACP methyl ester carboxylesterase
MIVLISAAVLIAAVLFLGLLTQAGVVLIARAHPARGRVIDVDGARLHVVDLGPAQAAGPPVVLLHGASSNLEVMRPLAERLAKTRRVILIDRPGHGWSTRDNFSDSTPQPQARMIAQALQQLGIKSAVIVAHSWSGALALRMLSIIPAASPAW